MHGPLLLGMYVPCRCMQNMLAGTRRLLLHVHQSQSYNASALSHYLPGCCFAGALKQAVSAASCCAGGWMAACSWHCVATGSGGNPMTTRQEA